MALVRAAGPLGAFAMIAAAPQSGDTARFIIGEHARAVDDARLGRIGERDLDDINAEQRRVLISRQPFNATRQLLFGADGARAGIVDDDPLFIAGDDRMRVRAAAGLHLAHLARGQRIADVKDPKAAETLLAHFLAHALTAAIHAGARILHGHQQEIAHNGDIPCPPDTRPS